MEALDPVPPPGGSRRFGDLRRRVAGVGGKMLIQHLRELTAAGVLTRRDHRQLPPVVDYTITPFGMTLVRALMPLCAWGVEHRAEVERIARPLADELAG